jgi:hypothetical protein
MEHLEHGEIELYDLEQDLGETANLAAKMPNQAKRLKTMLDQWRDDMHAAMPTPR